MEEDAGHGGEAKFTKHLTKKEKKEMKQKLEATNEEVRKVDAVGVKRLRLRWMLTRVLRLAKFA